MKAMLAALLFVPAFALLPAAGATTEPVCFAYNPAALTNACVVVDTAAQTVCVVGPECVPVPGASGYVEATILCGAAPSACRVTLP